jgi:signal transduction histidine kinase
MTPIKRSTRMTVLLAFAQFSPSGCSKPLFLKVSRLGCHWVLSALLWLWAGVVSAQSGVVVVQAQPKGVALSRMQVATDTATNPAERRPYTVAESAWQDVQMPDRWGQSRPGYSGSVWYRAHVNFESAPQAPWAVYLPRVIMNAEVWVNGVLVGSTGRMDEPITRHWNTPLLFSTPGSSWKAGMNTLHIRVVGFGDGASGLAVPQLGRLDVLSQKFETRRFWQNEFVYACNISVIALGIYVLAIWLRKRERADYGYFSMGAILWGIANFNMTVRQPFVSNAVWETTVFVCVVWALLALCLFTLRFSDRAPHWLERSIWVYAAAFAAFLILGEPLGAPQWGKFALFPVLMLGAWSMWQGAMFVRRTGTADYKLLGLVQVMTLFLGGHDWLIQIGHMPFETAYGLPFVAPLLVAALGWLIAGDYARVQSDLKTLNNELTDRIHAKELALRESFEKLSLLEKERVVSQERSRIMRDMHDGVGMYLSSALRQVQSGQVGTALVEQTLRDSLDHLKLTVDSMGFREGDVCALLGSLRYRLVPKLEAVGLTLFWHVDDLPLWPNGQIDKLRHLQYIVFEALSNALQHAQASALTLSATMEGAYMVINMEDDGQGFKPMQWSQGKGMRGMQERAQSMGASLQWLPVQPHGCKIVLRLPMQPD